MTESSTGKGDVFVGFEHPESNWSKTPHALIDALPQITSLGEMKVVLYLLRHTWGFQEFGEFKKITLDEFIKGRVQRDKKTNERLRMDSGTGLSKPTVIDGLRRAEEHGFIVSELDDYDKARAKKYYMLKMRDVESSLTPDVKNVDPRCQEVLHRTEKDTIERNQEKELRSANAESSDSGTTVPTEPSTPDKSPLDSRGVFVYEFIDNEYFEFECRCGLILDARHLKKSRLKCPNCDIPIEIRNSHGKVTHTPFIPKERQRVLGDIIPDCPEKLADIMYYANQAKQIKLLLMQNKEMLLESLNWAINKFIAGSMAENKIVTSALTWTGKRHETAQKSESQQPVEPLPQYEPALPEWMQ